jgi:predicted nucleotidyltransferase
MYIDDYLGNLQNLCQQNNVKSLYAIGSVLTDKFNNDSDIDLLVDIESNDPIVYAEHYFNLKFALQDLFKRKIDLLESKAIKNPYFLKNIDKSKRLIYAKGFK